MLSRLFKYENFEVFVNSRKLGKGISDRLTNKLLSYTDVDLIITSDHGSSDRKNLTILKEKLDCDVIVTDHHLFDDYQAPFNMDVFINPQKHDNELRDINGTHVLYYTLLHAFRKYTGAVNAEDTNYIYYLLTYVGITIISDCMDLKNYVNRKILKKVLSDLNRENTIHEPFWEYLLSTLHNSYLVDETTVGFKIAPLLNSPGRIANPRLSFELMIADNVIIAEDLYNEAKVVNDERKNKQKTVGKTEPVEMYTDGTIMVALLEDANGIQGVVANNYMFSDNYKVVMCFTNSRLDDGSLVYAGSGRSQDDNLNLKDIIDNLPKGISYGHGGHRKAVGAKVKPNLKEFYDEFKKIIDSRDVSVISKYVVDDYVFSLKKLTLHIFDVIDVGPYGIGFTQPVFVSDVTISDCKIHPGVNGNFISMKVVLPMNRNMTLSVFYNVSNKDIEEFKRNIKSIKSARIVYTININSYRNFNKILLQCEHLVFKESYK